MVRTRLRALRTSAGLSLEQLSARSNVGVSTISRIETGRRTISLDVLVPLAAALGVELDALVEVHDDDDVVIRPAPRTRGGMTTWPLSRPTSRTIAAKVRYEPTTRAPELRVHPGHDWFFVLDGVVRLRLGEREILVHQGEAAEFSTMTPHAIVAEGASAEVLMIFDHDGRRVHVHD
jgi:transcriptional regulator with XRE-family HTH domain